MSICSSCGAAFTCGMADHGGTAPCWCCELPKLPASVLQAMKTDTKTATASCYCPACLRAMLALAPSDQP